MGDVSKTVDEARVVARRLRMVEEQLVARGIKNRRVLEAMGSVPRHWFVEPDRELMAYADGPVPIGYGQTMSQPFMVARATELADPQPHERALEVGAGSGYQAAILAELCQEVYAVEIVPELAARARASLDELALSAKVVVEPFDGSAGWPEHAPYDVIIVSAGAPRVPPLLVDQLADGGRLVLPVGPPEEQSLVLIRRQGNDYETVTDTRCRYVDLQGRFGVHGDLPTA